MFVYFVTSRLNINACPFVGDK